MFHWLQQVTTKVISYMIQGTQSDGMSKPQIFKTYSMNNIYQINSPKLEYMKSYPVIRSKYLGTSSFKLTKSLTFTIFNFMHTIFITSFNK